MKLIDIIKGNTATFERLRQEKMHYSIKTKTSIVYFYIPLSDTKGGTFNNTDKASIFMRWIRKCRDSDELVSVKLK